MKRILLSLGGILFAVSIIANILLLVDRQHPVKAEPPVLSSQVDANNFQAVFLPNGQIYFGKLTVLDKDNFKLTDVYYLASDNALTKLGGEQHKPQDAMYIPRANVSFWENLQDAGQFGGQLK